MKRSLKYPVVKPQQKYEFSNVFKKVKKTCILIYHSRFDHISLNTVEPPNTAALGSWDWRKTTWYGE